MVTGAPRVAVPAVPVQSDFTVASRWSVSLGQGVDVPDPLEVPVGGGPGPEPMLLTGPWDRVQGVLGLVLIHRDVAQVVAHLLQQPLGDAFAAGVGRVGDAAGGAPAEQVGVVGAGSGPGHDVGDPVDPLGVDDGGPSAPARVSHLGHQVVAAGQGEGLARVVVDRPPPEE